MTWNLFIDDERIPTDVTWGEPVFYEQFPWTVARTLEEVKELITAFGFPDFISFDHDLGDNEPTGKDIADWIVEQDLDGTHRIPDEFAFHVHSMNPIGKRNIKELLTRYMECR